MATDNAIMLELINDACDMAGVPGIKQLDMRTLPQSPLIAKYHDTKIDMLMQFPWYFAEERYQMAHDPVITSTNPGMPYIYTFPDEWEVLNVWTVEVDFNRRNHGGRYYAPVFYGYKPKYIDFQVRNMRINGIDRLTLSTQASHCVATCTIDVDETMFRYNQPFKRALSLLLAMEYDIKLRQKPDLHQRLMAEFHQWLLSARDLDAINRGKEKFDKRTPFERSKYIRARQNG